MHIVELAPPGISEVYFETMFNRGLSKISIGQKNSGCEELSLAGGNGISEAYEMIRDNC